LPEICETQPELVAQHYTAAGCTEPAVPYWQRAGEQASNRSAHLEAVSHSTTGIDMKSFRRVLAGNIHKCLLKTSIEKVSLLRRLDAHPAVHRPGLASDIGRRRGGQEHCQVPHLLQAAHPSQGDGFCGGGVSLPVGLR
jgi:hypothetical protein